MKLKCGLLVVLIFILFSAMRCEGIDNDVFDEIEGVQLSNVDNSGKYPIFAVDSVPRSSYMLDVKFMANTTDSSTIANVYYFKEKVDAIKIFTNTNFDETHLAGSDVSDLFAKVPANYLYALTKAPNPGVYSFKVLVYKSNKVLEQDTDLVYLY